MKTLKWSLLMALVTGVSVSTFMLRTHSPRPLVTNANEQVQAVERTEAMVYEPSPLVTAPVRAVLSTVPPTPEKTDVPAADIVSQPANVVQIRANQVLAKVNDQAILLKHLVPLQPDEQEQVMTSEQYESRLNRAIEIELTFQAAAAQAVDLTPEQKKRVDGVVQRHEATLQEYRKQGVTWNSVTPAQVEFEKRLTSALMLQQNLVATEAHVAPASDPGVQARFEQARSEVLNRLKAQGNISVSTAEL
jgi:hypothetical protein